MLILRKFLQLFFGLLYHSFAWSYDWVASLVSLGRWKDWVLSTQPDLNGPKVLELGHGPGHLLVALGKSGIQVFGLDESRQMNEQAARRLSVNGLHPNVVNGYAQHLPFPSASFHQVVATFPSEYIIDPLSIASIRRVLAPGGELLILPAAWITGRSLPDRLAAALFHITGQAPQWDDAFLDPLHQAGFRTDSELRNLGSSKLILIHARKPDLNLNTQS